MLQTDEQLSFPHLFNHVFDFLLLTVYHVVQVLDSFPQTGSFLLRSLGPDTAES